MKGPKIDSMTGQTISNLVQQYGKKPIFFEDLHAAIAASRAWEGVVIGRLLRYKMIYRTRRKSPRTGNTSTAWLLTQKAFRWLEEKRGEMKDDY